MGWRSAAIGLVGLLAMSAACDDTIVGWAGHNDEVALADFSYAASATGRSALVLEGITGTVEIQGSASASEVSVSGTRKVESHSRTDARRRLDDLRVVVSETSSAVRVRTVQPSNTDGRNYVVDYRVVVPGGFDVRVDHVTGSVTVERTTGDVDVTNVTGRVEVEAQGGNVHVDLVTGEIVASTALSAGGQVSLITVTGSITLSIPPATSAMLDASVVTGSIALTNLVLADPDVGPRWVRGRLGDGDGRIEVSTVTGSITVRGG